MFGVVQNFYRPRKASGSMAEAADGRRVETGSKRGTRVQR